LARLVYAVAASAAFCAQAIGAPAFAAQPRAVVEGDLTPELKTAISRAVGETDRPIENRFEARRRARAAAEDAIAVLRSEGYYAYDVQPDVGSGEQPTALVRVKPGPRFMLAGATITWVGDPPDAKAQTAATTALHLRNGEPGRAVEVVGAEGRAVSAVQRLGYADAQANPREVVVDHADRSVRPTFKIVAGELVRLDGLDVTTDGATSKAWLQHLAPWKSGDTYDPEDVAELERRLLDTGVYDSVTVALAPADKKTVDGLRPIVVSLAERKRRTLELGASYATSEGAGADARWTHYNVLGRADTLALVLRASNIDSKAEVDLTLPHWRRPQQTLNAAGGFYRNQTDAYDETGVGVRGDVTRRYGKTSYITVGASLDLSRTEELKVETLMPLGRDLVTIGTLANLNWDRSDDPLNPKRGWRFGARAEPTLIVGEGGDLPYLKLQTQASAYLPVGPQARTVLAARVRFGSILNGTVDEIPASRRFYAGGGGSVRGFAYQAVGPQLDDDTPQGGVSLFEGSLEARHDLTARWGVVAFVDAGSVGSDPAPGFQDLSVGAGLGVRYNLGFAPIRFDIAVPVTDRHGSGPFQLYISIGQSF
jgi:translocation and assembly module TamA